jgi:rhodanese-related sulfurtransferase
MVAVVAGSQAMMWGVGLTAERIAKATPSGAPAAITRAEDAPRMTVDQLYKRQQQAQPQTVIDLRSALEFEAGHISGAINVPFELLGRWAADQKPEEKRRPVVLYCACRTEHSSAAGAMLLRNQGFAEAWALKGGWTTWHKDGKPIHQGKQP